MIRIIAHGPVARRANIVTRWIVLTIMLSPCLHKAEPSWYSRRGLEQQERHRSIAVGQAGLMDRTAVLHPDMPPDPGADFRAPWFVFGGFGQN
jgi:hypothetical protein